MGIKDFSKTFKPDKIIMFKDIKNTRIAFDIMSELWRSALGTKNIKTLTDKFGNSTVHISVMLANIIQLAKNKVEIIGCFDYNKKSDETYHNPIKYLEIKKRQNIKEKAKKILEEDELISDNSDNSDNENNENNENNDEEEKIFNNPKKINNNMNNKNFDNNNVDDKNFDNNNVNDKNINNSINDKNINNSINDKNINNIINNSINNSINNNLDNNSINNNLDNNSNYTKKIKKDKLTKDKKAMLEKQAFSVNVNMINDIKFLFDCLNIKYLESPKTYEGEYMCSYLEQNKYVDGCFSNDTDLIAFGCKKFYRRNPRDKKIYIYTQEKILEQIGEDSNINDIRKISVILGCDFCEKTKK